MTKTKTKLAPAKDWRNRPIESWNVLTFTEYLKDAHKEITGLDYAPFGGRWAMEQGILGDLIGTASRNNPKPRTASNEVVKRFIDEAFATYTPNDRFPGTSLGFTWTYRKEVWQRIQAEERATQKREQAKEDAPSLEELGDWL